MAIKVFEQNLTFKLIIFQNHFIFFDYYKLL